MSGKIDFFSMGHWDCPWYEAEIGLARAIPRRLLRWAIQAKIITRLNPTRLLYVLLFGALIRPQQAEGSWSDLARHLFEKSEQGQIHQQQMEYILISRMSLIECPDTSALFLVATSGSRDVHVEHCPDCRSQIGYLKSMLDFRQEYDVLQLKSISS